MVATLKIDQDLLSRDPMGRSFMVQGQLLAAAAALTADYADYVSQAVAVSRFQSATFLAQIDFGDAASVEVQVERSDDGGDSWMPLETEGSPSSGVYTYKPRTEKFLAADEAAGVGVEALLGALADADMDSTADQEIELTELATLDAKYAIYQVSRIVAKDPSTSLTTAVGGINSAAAGGGVAVVAASQVYSALVNPADTLELTLNAPTRALGAGSLFLKLATPQGAAATADFDVYGTPAPSHEIQVATKETLLRVKVKQTGGTDNLPMAQVFFRGGR